MHTPAQWAFIQSGYRRKVSYSLLLLSSSAFLHSAHLSYLTTYLSHPFQCLTLMLLVTYSANTKWRKKLRNDWNRGIWVLIWEYSVWAIHWIPTWQSLDDLQKSLHSSVLSTKVASALEGLSYFCSKHNNAKIYENHLHPVVMVFIG